MATLQEEFIGMINAKNPDLGLTLADVDFGNPTNYVPSVEGDTRNSALVITAKADSPNFKGSKEYHFFRFNLTHPNGEDTWSQAIKDLVSNYDTDQKILDAFNRNLPNHPLTLDEVTITRSEPIEVEDGDMAVDFKIKIDPNHLKWQGAFVIRIFGSKDNLSFKEAELDGFV